MKVYCGTDIIEVERIKKAIEKNDRFKTKYDYTDGCVADATAQDINILFASVETVKTVPKISSIYYFNAGQHTEGDGDLYQNRALWDTFVFPNGIDNKVDSIFVDMTPAG